MDSSLVIVLIVVGVIAIGFFAVAIYLIVRLLKLYSAVRSGAMPMKGKVAFWAALVYGISPVDLMPAPIYADDVAVLAGAVAYVGSLARKHGLRRNAEPGLPLEPGQRLPAAPPKERNLRPQR